MPIAIRRGSNIQDNCTVHTEHGHPVSIGPDASVGHGAVADATFSRLVDAVRELAGRRPAFVHCSSGNRVGAGLLPYFMLEQGLDEEEAVAQAMQVGLRSAEMVEQALEYVRSRQGI